MAFRALAIGLALVLAPVLTTLLAPGLGASRAEPFEIPGRVEVLPEAGDHWVWVPDRLLHHSVLFDGDSGRVLGMIDGPVGAVTPKLPLHAPVRGELYSVDIAYSRGTRGDRIDFVTIYDTSTLAVTGEILLPTRTADANTSLGYAALLDGERFLATFNQFPNASVSIVDLETRSFIGEILITGCAGIFPVGERRFATLCGDGTIAVVELDDSGRKRGLAHSERFFDPIEDPVTMAGVRMGERWVFASFEGHVHVLEFGEETPRALPAWSLLDEADRADAWRVGGLQHLAVHAASNRLFSLMHRGGRGSHKAPGPEIWVYDLARRERVDRFEVPNLTAAFLGPMMQVEPGGLVSWGLRRLLPSTGAHSLAVTQDAEPLLFARSAELGAVAVLDARTGEHLRDLSEAGLAGPTLGLH
jgi:methylamine dehydrogenase heavy chain